MSVSQKHIQEDISQEKVRSENGSTNLSEGSN